MSSTGRRSAAAVLIALLAAPAAHAAAGEGWSFEITPYIWAVNLEGDFTIGGRQVSVHKSFDELLESVDIGGALLLRGQVRRVLFFGQFDFYSMSDDIDNPPAPAKLDSDVFIGTLAVGYQFGGDLLNADLALGGRRLSLDNELRLGDLGRFKRSIDVTDPLVFFAPSARLSKRWRFSLAFAYGAGGDSKMTYDFQPQFLCQVSKHFALRVGYRKLYYDISGERSNRWKGSFQGVFIGAGGTFGSAQ